MKVLSFGVAFLGAVAAFDLESSPAVTQTLVDSINSMGTTWKAAIPAKFQNATLADVRKYMGTILRGDPRHEELPAKTDFPHVESLPENFDARTAWPQCSNVIGHVRDQSSCGSCWAFGSTEAFNDRYCIKTGSQVLFSPTDTLACCTGPKCGFSLGCNGGQPSGAWRFFVNEGVVTGGDYGDIGSGDSCSPYPFPPCAHHVEPTEEYPECPDNFKTPKCTSTCTESGYGITFSNDKTFAKSSYAVKGEENIMKEIMTKGTVSVALKVYEDFMTYTSGVYQHKTGKYLGGHAIKMVGWGVDNGVKYWTCINSWNDSWGEGGAFRILRGVDECGIESDVVAGDV